MKRRTTLQWLVSLGTTVVLMGCTPAGDPGPASTGPTGPGIGAQTPAVGGEASPTTGTDRDADGLSSEERTIANASAVELLTSGDLTITVGSGPSLTVMASPSVLERLTSDVHDGVLVLGIEGVGGGLRLEPIEYDLVLPSLDGITARGSGDIDVDVLTSDRLALEVTGSGSVTASGLDVALVTVDILGSGSIEAAGSADRQEVVVSGAGAYAAADLASVDTVVSVLGSGQADVTATGTLDAEVLGSGTVTYAGGAQVTPQVAGSGQVRPR